MSKYLITGASGFVARHFIDLLDETEVEYDILGIDLAEPKYAYGHAFTRVDLLDYAALEEAIAGFSPDYIVHLAAFSSVGKSWEKPSECFSNNSNIFLNLLEILRKGRMPVRVLSVGSSEEYGAVEEEWLPLREECRLAPSSPYAVARVAQEQLSMVYARSYGLDIVLTRSFNHLGAGQSPVFAVPSIAKQFVDAPGGGTVALAVGDTTVVRDFTDVRDVVRAYALLLREGASGEVYNVCSGAGHSLDEIIAMLGCLTGRRYETITDPGKLRPSDNRTIIGDNTKLSLRTGWEPTIELEDSLSGILRDFSGRKQS